MSHNGEPRFKTAARATLAAAALLYFVGPPAERAVSDLDLGHVGTVPGAISQKQGKAALAAENRRTKEIRAKIEQLRGMDSDHLEGLSYTALFHSAVAVQLDVVSLSAQTGSSDQAIFEALVPEQVRDVYNQHHINFTYIEPNPNDPNCMTPYTILVPGNGAVESYIPLVATPQA